MMISGHQTRSVFDRYNFVSERDLHGTARKLAQYIHAQKPAPLTHQPMQHEYSQGDVASNLLI